MPPIRERIAALGHSQSSFAREIGVSVRTVQRWVAGAPLPGPMHAILNGLEACQRFEVGTARLLARVKGREC